MTSSSTTRSMVPRVETCGPAPIGRLPAAAHRSSVAKWVRSRDKTRSEMTSEVVLQWRGHWRPRQESNLRPAVQEPDGCSLTTNVDGARANELSQFVPCRRQVHDREVIRSTQPTAHGHIYIAKPHLPHASQRPRRAAFIHRLRSLRGRGSRTPCATPSAVAPPPTGRSRVSWTRRSAGRCQGI